MLIYQRYSRSAKLNADRAQQEQDTTESWAFRTMIDAEFATILQRSKLYIEERRRAHDSAHAEMLDAKGALYLSQQRLECVAHQRQSDFNELCRLEALVDSMHEKCNLTSRQ